MTARTYRITTLGCRVNHAETRDIEALLRSRGLVPAPAGRPADVEVVHTCTVTRTAAAKSRHAIRRAARRAGAAAGGSGGEDAHDRAPEAAAGVPTVFVTGCYASSDAAEAARLAGDGERVLPQDGGDGTTIVERLARRLDDLEASSWRAGRAALRQTVRGPEAGCSTRPAGGAPLPLPVVPLPDDAAARHVRAELKVQDGCDARCTFCIIPSLRPALRSKRVADAVAEARMLVDRGHREIVITGIFLGAYGHPTALRRRQDPAAGRPLADLVDAVAAVPGRARLRISSLEPGDVDEPLLDAMVAGRPVVVPHLHLPLQSGSDRILRRMNRQYAAGDYLDMLDRVEAALTEDGLPPALTTDVICGFPGETDEDFARTVEVARRAGFLHMHVFPYSPRPGTAAARWRDRHVPAEVARARVRALIDLERDPDEGLAVLYRRRLAGRTLRVILEQPDRSRPGAMTGRCDHYALVSVRTDRPRGTLVEVVADDVAPDAIIARPAPRRHELPLVHS